MRAREFIKEADPIQIQQGPDISPELRRYKERGTMDTFGGNREFGVQDIVGGGAARAAKISPTAISTSKPVTDPKFQRMMDKVTSTPAADPGFQRSMGKVTKEFDPVHHQRLYREYEKNPQYYTTPPAPGQDSYLHAQSLAQFVMNRYPKADIDTLKNIAQGLTTISANKALNARRERGY